jgi:thioredoxin 1
VIDLTHEDLKQYVIQNKITCCIEVRADWSGECYLMEVVLHQFEKEFAGLIEFAKTDIEVQQEIARDYGITELPFLLLFKKGELVECLIGLQAKKKLHDALKKLAAEDDPAL